MKRHEHLLIILAEECAEVQQAATKALRFGLHEQRDLPTSNYDRLRAELNDIWAVVEMVEHACDVSLEKQYDAIKAKQEKVEKYLKYSYELGTLDDYP